jgi:hypothetical protein
MISWIGPSFPPFFLETHVQLVSISITQPFLTNIFNFLYNFVIKFMFWRFCHEATDENNV